MKKILIVEDSETIREMVAYRLTESGYDVETASDGKEGLRKIKEVKPDLVVLDIRMPGMDGFEVCEKAKADPAIKHIPILFLTTATQKADYEKGRECGADGYVTKPYEGTGLVDEVKRVLQKKQIEL